MYIHNPGWVLHPLFFSTPLSFLQLSPTLWKKAPEQTLLLYNSKHKMSSGFHRFYSKRSSFISSSLRGSVPWFEWTIRPPESNLQQAKQQEASFLAAWQQSVAICFLMRFLLSDPWRCPAVQPPALQAPCLQCPGLACPCTSNNRLVPLPIVFALPSPMGYKNVEVTAHFTKNHNQFNFNLRDASVNRKKSWTPTFPAGFSC